MHVLRHPLESALTLRYQICIFITELTVCGNLGQFKAHGPAKGYGVAHSLEPDSSYIRNIKFIACCF